MHLHADTTDIITVQQNTPLIMINSDNAQPMSHLDEPNPPKWLRQNIGQLNISSNVTHIHPAISNALSDVAIASINVFTLLKVDGVFA